VPTDTTGHHFQHFRRAFTLHGLPVALYTDALSLFGYQSTTDGRDPRSEFQRALTALGVTHLVAPSPQAKEFVSYCTLSVRSKTATEPAAFAGAV